MEAVKAAEQGEVPVGAVVVCRDWLLQHHAEVYPSGDE